MCQANLWNLTKKCIIIGSIATDPMKAINLEQFTVSESDHLHSAVAASTPLSPGGGRRDANISAASQHPSPPLSHWQYWPSVIRRPEDGHPIPHHVVEQHGDRIAYGRNHTVYIRNLVRTTNTFLWRKVYSVPCTSLSILFGCHWEYIGLHFLFHWFPLLDSLQKLQWMVFITQGGGPGPGQDMMR